MSKKITVELGQSLVDIATQEYGSAEGIIELLRANSTIEQGDELTPGTELVIDSEAVNVAVADSFESAQLKVATNQTYIAPATTQPYYEVNYIINGYFE